MSGATVACAGRRAGQLALAAVSLLGACYVYRPVTTVEPHAGIRVAVDLNDQGRAALVTSVGPDIARVEGVLLSSTGGEYVIRVSEVVGVQGMRTKWNGETVSVREEYVKQVRQKTVSGRRTAFLVSGMLGGVVGLAAGVHLVGFGGGGDAKGSGPGNDQ